MPVWRNARLRRLYGKPDDPIETPTAGAPSGSRTRGLVKQELSTEKQAEATPTPPPAPKRVKKEKTRPQSEYELVQNMPATQSEPDYSLLTKPLTEEEANVTAYAIHSSRQNWLNGSMFETFWTRKPKRKTPNQSQANLREKMTKLHECSVTLGPHTFPIKLFTVKDDNSQQDDEADREIEEKLNKEKEELRAKQEAEARARAPVPDDSSKTPGGSEAIGQTHNDKETAAQEEQQRASVEEPKLETTTATEKKEMPETTRDPHADDSEDKSANNSLTNGNSVKKEEDSKEKEGSEGQNADEKSSNEQPQNEQPPKEQPPKEVPPDVQPPNEVPPKEVPPNEQPPNEVPPNEVPPNEQPPKEEPPKEETKMDKPESKAKSKGRKKKTAKKATQKSSAETQEAFENERERLELEKKKNLELEQKLRGAAAPSDSSKDSEPAAASSDPAQSTQSAGTQPATTAAETTEQQSQVQSPAQPAQPAQPTQQIQSEDHSVQQPQVQQPSPVQLQQQPQSPAAFQQQRIPPPEMPRTPPNQLVVYRLQQMAARDPALSELMKHVASGTAPPDSIAKFQEVINRVKASIFTPPPQFPTIKKPSGGKKRKEPPTQAQAPPAKQHQQQQPTPQRLPTTYHPRANAKAIMLALEFDESPTDRYLLPKRSIIEYLPEKGDLLWSFLYITEPQSRDEKKLYTPVTATFHDIPLRVAQTLERCVRKPEVVRVHMKNAMAEAERAEPWNIWFQVEKQDEVLLDLMRKSSAPYLAPPPPPRKPAKPRKPRGPTAAQLRAQQERERIEFLNKVKRGQPLPTRDIRLLPGQPFVQPPSTVFIHRRFPIPNYNMHYNAGGFVGPSLPMPQPFYGVPYQPMPIPPNTQGLPQPATLMPPTSLPSMHPVQVPSPSQPEQQEEQKNAPQDGNASHNTAQDAGQDAAEKSVQDSAQTELSPEKHELKSEPPSDIA